MTDHPFNRPDMITLKHVATGEIVPHPVNIEKLVTIPEPDIHDLQASNDSVVEIQHDTPLPTPAVVSPDHDLVQVAYQFGNYLHSLPSKSATAPQACKFVSEHFPSSRESLVRHGRLRGVVKSCPYLQLNCTASSGTYVLSRNETFFDQILLK